MERLSGHLPFEHYSGASSGSETLNGGDATASGACGHCFVREYWHVYVDN